MIIIFIYPLLSFISFLFILIFDLLTNSSKSSSDLAGLQRHSDFYIFLVTISNV